MGREAAVPGGRDQPLLAILNLIPPLDGFAVVTALVPPRWEYVIRQYQGYGIVLLLLLFIVPNSPLSAVLGLAYPWAAALRDLSAGPMRPTTARQFRDHLFARVSHDDRAKAHALLPTAAAASSTACPAPTSGMRSRSLPGCGRPARRSGPAGRRAAA